MTLRSCRTTWSSPSLVRTPMMSAREGEYSDTAVLSTLCQTGKITFLEPERCFWINPFSSHSGHRFRKKLGLSTTIPNRDLESPKSIDRLRLIPTVRVKRSEERCVGKECR